MIESISHKMRGGRTSYESLEKPEIRVLDSGWTRVDFGNRNIWAQIPINFNKKIIPDEYIFSPSLEFEGIRNRDRINNWWKSVNYKLDKKETLGTLVGGFGKPVHAFSGTVHYLPKEYKEEQHMSKAKQILKVLEEIDSWEEEEDESSPKFFRIVDLDERGSYRAHIEDENGKVVFEYSNEEEVLDDEGEPTGEVEYGELSMVTDGFMKHVDDIDGLEKYLKEMKVIPKDGDLYDMKDPKYKKYGYPSSRFRSKR